VALHLRSRPVIAGLVGWSRLDRQYLAQPWHDSGAASGQGSGGVRHRVTDNDEPAEPPSGIKPGRGWAYRWSGQSLAAGFGLAITAPQDAAVHASELGKRALGKLLWGSIGAGPRTARVLARDRLVAGGWELGYPWGMDLAGAR
jgi:hypothetical protein